MRKGVFFITVLSAKNKILAKLNSIKNLHAAAKKPDFMALLCLTAAFSCVFVSAFEQSRQSENVIVVEAESLVDVSEVTNPTEMVQKLGSFYENTPPVSEIFVTDTIEQTEEGYSVYLDGELVGNVSLKGKENLEKAVGDFLLNNQSDREGAKTELLQQIEYVSGEFDAKTISDSKAILAEMTLTAVTVYEVSERSSVSFDTVNELSDKLFVGCKAVSVEGECGEAVTTYKFTEKNGAVIAKEKVKSVIVTEPTAQVVLVGTKVPVSLSAEDIKNAEGFVFPLTGKSCYVTSQFGYREFDGSFHTGTDYAADEGTEVYCAADGVVTFSGWDDTGYGNYVVVTHANGYSTGYAHLSSICVSEGQTVTAGEVLGGVGSTGYSTGNHLHLNVMLGSELVDPELIF